MLDTRVGTVNHNLSKALLTITPSFYSSIYVTASHPFSGRSYEMSLCMSMLGYTGIFTGEILDVHHGIISFGPSGMMDKKRRAVPGLITSATVPYVAL